MPQRPKAPLPPIDTGHETIGERLARFRKGSGLTQMELAEQIGISQALISKYEKGLLNLSADMLFRFASVLNVSADKILGLDQPQDESQQPSLRITKRVREIEALPENKKKAILKTIDDLIRANS